MREELEKKEKRDNEAGESAVAVCCSSESVVEREGEFLPLRSSRSPLLSSPLFCQIKEAGTCGEPAAHRHLPQAATPPPPPPIPEDKDQTQLHSSTALCSSDAAAHHRGLDRQSTASLFTSVFIYLANTVAWGGGCWGHGKGGFL